MPDVGSQQRGRRIAESRDLLPPDHRNVEIAAGTRGRLEKTVDAVRAAAGSMGFVGVRGTVEDRSPIGTGVADLLRRAIVRQNVMVKNPEPGSLKGGDAVVAFRQQQMAVKRVGVNHQAGAELLQISNALRAAGAAARLVQRRQQHGGENRDDRNHDKKFYQGKFPFHDFHAPQKVVPDLGSSGPVAQNRYPVFRIKRASCHPTIIISQKLPAGLGV